MNATRAKRKGWVLAGALIFGLMLLGGGCVDSDTTTQPNLTCSLQSRILREGHPEPNRLLRVLNESDRRLCEHQRRGGEITVSISTRAPMSRSEAERLIARHNCRLVFLEAFLGYDNVNHIEIGSSVMGRAESASDAFARMESVAQMAIQSNGEFLAELRESSRAASETNEISRISRDMEIARREGPRYFAFGCEVRSSELPALFANEDISYVIVATAMSSRPHGVNPINGEWR